MNYEAISYISGLALPMSGLIIAGSGTMLTYYYFRKATGDESEQGEFNKKIKNTFIGGIFTLSIANLINILRVFFEN